MVERVVRNDEVRGSTPLLSKSGIQTGGRSQAEGALLPLLAGSIGRSNHPETLAAKIPCHQEKAGNTTALICGTRVFAAA